MARRERRDGAAIMEKRKNFAAGRWAMLGLLGAGAVGIAIHQQANRRKSRRTRLDAARDAAHREENVPETDSHYVEAAGGRLQTQPEPVGGAATAPEAVSKMNDDAPFRERTLPKDGRRTPHREQNEPRIVDQHQMEPDAIAAGGNIGELEGDKQSFGEVPTIMDQNESTPAL